MIVGEALVVYAIYDGTKTAYPDVAFVVQPWFIVRGTYKGGGPLACRTLDEARSYIPPGMYRMDPLPDDDPSVIESWL